MNFYTFLCNLHLPASEDVRLSSNIVLYQKIRDILVWLLLHILKIFHLHLTDLSLIRA